MFIFGLFSEELHFPVARPFFGQLVDGTLFTVEGEAVQYIESDEAAGTEEGIEDSSGVVDPELTCSLGEGDDKSEKSIKQSEIEQENADFTQDLIPRGLWGLFHMLCIDVGIGMMWGCDKIKRVQGVGFSLNSSFSRLN